MLGLVTTDSPLIVSHRRGMFQPANFPLNLEERVRYNYTPPPLYYESSIRSTHSIMLWLMLVRTKR